MGILDRVKSFFIGGEKAVVPNEFSFATILNQGSEETFTQSDITRLYLGWVKVAVDVIAEKIASLNWYFVDENGERVEKDDRVWQLWKKPNPYLNSYSFLERLVVNLELFGFSPVRIVDESTLAFLDPVATRIEIDDQGRPTEVRVQVGKRYRTYSIRDVIPFHSFHPTRLWEGRSTIEANFDTFKAMEKLAKWEHKLFESMIPPLAVIFKNVTSEEELERVRLKLKKIYGGTKNAFEPIVGGGEIEVKKIGLTPRELSLAEIESAIRDKVLGVFRVPKAVVGVVEDVNRANAEASLETFLRNTIEPKARRITEFFNDYLFEPRFGVRLAYSLPKVGDPYEKVAQLVIATGNKPLLSVNEAREILGKERLETPDADLVEPIMLEAEIVEKKKEAEELEKKINSLKKKLRRLEELLTNEVKAELWVRTLAKKVDESEKVLKKMFQEYGKNLERRLVERLQNLKTLKIGPALTKGIIEVQSEAQLIEKFLLAYYRWVYSRNKGDIEQTLQLDKPLPELDVEKLYREAVRIKADSIANTVYKRATKIIQEKLQEGADLMQMIEAVKTIGKWVRNEEAERVARTESTFIENDVNYRIYEQAGVKKLMWITMGDHRVRDAHKTLHGQVRPLGKPFVSGLGNELKYPGDPSAPVEEIVNCRCRVVAEM